MYALTLSSLLSLKIYVSIEERGRAVGMVSAGSSQRQVSVLIKNKEAYRQFVTFFGNVLPFKLKDLLYSEFVTFQNRFFDYYNAKQTSNVWISRLPELLAEVYRVSRSCGQNSGKQGPLLINNVGPEGE